MSGLDGGLVPFTSSGLQTLRGSRERRRITGELERVHGTAVVAAAEEGARAALTLLHERGRGQLADAAAIEVASLSALEEQVAKTTPAAAPRVAAIVNAYTTGAVRTVLKW